VEPEAHRHTLTAGSKKTSLTETICEQFSLFYLLFAGNQRAHTCAIDNLLFNMVKLKYGLSAYLIPI